MEVNSGTTAVRPGYGFDEAALENWLTANLPGFAGPLMVQQFRGGQSNPTYLLTTPGHRYVLRRKPPGPLLKGAHAIEREAQVLIALAKADYPVAQVHALCMDPAIIGTPFYVMDMVEGRIFWDAALADTPKADRAAIYDAMNDAMARLHQVNYEAIGLGEFGRPGNYFERQIARWSRQYEDNLDAGRDENLDRVIDWFRNNIPADDDKTSLIHGDFRIDNLIFHPTEPRVVAVLDWELSTLGHPAADFAYNAMMYRMPPHIVAGLGNQNPIALGLPSESDYVAAYCARTGQSGLPAFGFYMAFNFFRLAAIFHGIKGRVLQGTAASAHASQRAAQFPELCALAWQQAERASS